MRSKLGIVTGISPGISTSKCRQVTLCQIRKKNLCLKTGCPVQTKPVALGLPLLFVAFLPVKNKPTTNNRKQNKHKHMSDLIKCKGCGQEVSPDAKACPKCGAPVKKKSSILKKVGYVITCLIVLRMIGCMVSSGNHSSSASSPSSEASNKQTDQSIDAGDVIKLYGENKVAFQNKYVDKAIELRGVVYQVSDSDGGWVEIEGDEHSMVGIKYMTKDNKWLATLKKGDPVRVKGVIKGKSEEDLGWRIMMIPSSNAAPSTNSVSN